MLNLPRTALRRSHHKDLVLENTGDAQRLNFAYDRFDKFAALNKILFSEATDFQVQLNSTSTNKSIITEARQIQNSSSKSPTTAKSDVFF